MIGLKLIPVLGSQLAGDISHKPSNRLPLLSARTAVTFPPQSITAKLSGLLGDRGT